MTFYTKPRCLLLILVAASTSQAFCQDVRWTQPYSGNVVYGPLVTSGGKLPNCPDCQCESCQSCGPKGFVKRLFGGICDKVRSGRREYYYCKQVYHTMYTKPVLPPYCEVGHGYYQTSWRQGGVSVCDPVGGYALPPVEEAAPSPEIPPPPAPLSASSSAVQPDPRGQPDSSAVQPVPSAVQRVPSAVQLDPSAMQANPYPSTKLFLLNELEQQKEAEVITPASASSVGDEKPRFQAPAPKSDQVQWKRVTPLGRQLYYAPVITPR